MRGSWIQSAIAYNISSCCSWIIVLLGIAVILMLTPWINLVQGATTGALLVRTLGASIGVASVVAGPAIFLGMATFCFIKDRSPRSVKLLWFVVFVLTACFGSAAYFFAVYRRYAKPSSTVVQLSN